MTLITRTYTRTVSAFYAEVPTKNMYVTGWIHAKSKFLGLSLGVHQIGLGQYMCVYSYNLIGRVHRQY